jgi:glycosyltransferase involved in cell wall biosynthesis
MAATVAADSVNEVPGQQEEELAMLTKQSPALSRGARRLELMRGPSYRRRVLLVGTHPPTECGLATFTANLRAAIAAPGSGWRADVARLVEEPEPHPPNVVCAWVRGDLLSLYRCLEVASSYDAVLLQHEYGLYGGEEGEDVLVLVDALDVPLVAVLHTVLLEPKPKQRQILEHVIEMADAVVVQSRAARERLASVHGLDPGEVEVVPHGAAANFSPLPGHPVVPGRFPGRLGPQAAAPPSCDAGTGLASSARRPVALTWGLLGPGKGIEHAIRAVAMLRQRGLEVGYVVAGRTHPKVKALRGERYREGLISLARELGVGDLVAFDDSYRDWASLRALVRSADVVVLPYDSTDQVSSGVLVEAVASARPVVATRFPHALELLEGGAGVTVPHKDPDALARALERVLFEPGFAEAMAQAAYREAQALLWPAVGASYRSLVEGVVRAKLAG